MNNVFVFSSLVLLVYENNPRVPRSPQNQRRIKGFKIGGETTLAFSKIGNLVKYYNLTGIFEVTFFH